jgi:hypothetical protein
MGMARVGTRGLARYDLEQTSVEADGSMLLRIMSMSCAALSMAACSGAVPKPDPNLAMQCELVQCECQDPANPLSRGPLIWNPDGTAACPAGRELVRVKGEKSPSAGPGGIVIPTYDECAHAGVRSGAGRLGRGARVTDCGF